MEERVQVFAPQAAYRAGEEWEADRTTQVLSNNHQCCAMLSQGFIIFLSTCISAEI